MRDREEQVNYDICKSAQQDEASYNNEVKKDQDHYRGLRKRRDEGDGEQDDSIVEKGLEMRRVMLGTVVPYYMAVVNQRQDVRLEVEDQKKLRKKPGKTPEEGPPPALIPTEVLQTTGVSGSADTNEPVSYRIGLMNPE